MRGAPHSGLSWLICRINSRSSRLTLGLPGRQRDFQAPIGPKPHPMPPQDRVGLNNARQTEQAWPKPGHPYQRRSVTGTQSHTVRHPPHANIELMTEKKVLDFKLAPRLEQVGDENANQLEESEYRI